MDQLRNLRILHHWSCSGGTLISKCIAALPDIIFLSEIHPEAYLRMADTSPTSYLPTDVCQQLSMTHNGRDAVLSRSAFKGAIAGLSTKCNELDLNLVIRSHDHVDFFTGAHPKEVFTTSDCFQDDYNLLEILTIRHPLDCWLSLSASNWADQMSFASIDVFCSRCLAMLKAARNLPAYKYETFALDPDASMKVICKCLDLDFDPIFRSKFAMIILSGDSGRQGPEICPRPRRPISNELERNLLESSQYEEACGYMGYNPNPDAEYPYIL